MNFSIQTQWSKAVIVCTVAIFAGMNRLAVSETSSCSLPEYRQFDFWAGEWDVYEIKSSAKVAHAQVDRILDGCVLHERYERKSKGLVGQSFSIYDPGTKMWRQSWVTNQGESLIIEGKLEDGGMVLTGKDNTNAMVRTVWKPVSEGVRETAVASTDNGKTWQPSFDLLFRKVGVDPSAGADPSDVQKTIAALDTEYQAAVKRNDTATMDRLLADNFTLVTGSGKIYSKADLLDEARNGWILYDHQEDDNQSVRVWGDTAVISAKLKAAGTQDGKPFDYTVFFSDTYVRTPAGWRYVFGQSSLPLPKTAEHSAE